MIIKEERSKKRKRFLLIFLGGFILGAAIMFPLASLLTSNKQNGASIINNTVAINENKTSTASANNSTTNTVNSSEHNTSSTQGPAATNSSEVKDKNSIASSGNEPTADKKAVTKKKDKKTKTADNPNTYAYVRPASERKHKKPMANPAVDNDYDKYLARKNKANNTVANNTNQNNSSANNSAPKNNDNKNTGVTDNNNAPANNATQQNPSANNTSSANNSTPAASNTNNATANNNTQANNNNQPKTDSNKLQANAQVNPTNQNKSFVTQDNKTADASKPVFKPSNTLSIDAGAGYSLGWNNENGKGGSGITPVLGIRLNHSFSDKISLGVGLRYYGLTNLNCPYSSTVISYDFGYTSTGVTVSPQMLHYAALPLEFQYHLNKKNVISLGGTLLYMLNSTSEVTTTTQNSLTAPASQKKTVWGYTDGFSQFDGQLVIAYRRKLFGSFGASVEAYYGLTDVEMNSFFLSNSFERNSGFRLILSYDFGK